MPSARAGVSIGLAQARMRNAAATPIHSRKREIGRTLRVVCIGSLPCRGGPAAIMDLGTPQATRLGMTAPETRHDRAKSGFNPAGPCESKAAGTTSEQDEVKQKRRRAGAR